jgi:hypothetical protein
MYLFLAILLSMVLGYFLLVIGPIFGGVIAFGVIAGSLFRAVYLLNDIRKRLAVMSPDIKMVSEQKQVSEIIPVHLQSSVAYKKHLAGKQTSGESECNSQQ